MKIERVIHRIIVLWIVLLSPFTFHLSLCSARTSQVGIGVRGGGQMYMLSAAPNSNGEVKAGMGGIGAIDLRYTFYEYINAKVNLGFLVGAEIGYGATQTKGTYTDQYTNFDYLGNQIDYTNEAKYRQTDKCAQADFSLMLAACFGHFTVNVGPKFMMPVSASSNLKIKEAHINAYFPRYDVHVTDKMITGALETPYKRSVSSNLPKYNLLFGAEIGYEWAITEKMNLGVQAFADIAVWGQQSPVTDNLSPLLAVAPITDAENPSPAVTVNTVSGQIKNMRYVDFGLRAYVAFTVAEDNGYRYHFHSRRNTRRHRNRYRWW